uniref:Reverse transcriptase domain-containing protein n=1 Tax=Tanacetum cinerariifolium TaxID=118510 RepID=A0A6L2JX02_TANCI|nr:hypothetical protein [Tanacetum cinerariifolium]
MTLDIHNWSSFAHQELNKIVKDEIFPIVNQVDARVQNFEIQVLKEAAKFVRDFKSLAKEADESLAKHKALEYEIERLLRAAVLPKIDESNALSKPVTSNSTPSTQESQVVNNDKVIAPGMFRINPFKTSRKEKSMPNKPVKASVRPKPITISQPSVIHKKDVNSDSNNLSSTRIDNTAKTKRPQPSSNTKNDRVPFASKSSCIKNKEVEVEEYHMNLLLSKTLNVITLSLLFGLDLTYAPSTISSQKPTEHELDLLFEAMYDDYIGSQPSAATRTALAAQQLDNQALLQTETVADNVINAMFDGNTFVNPFASPSTGAAESSSSQYVDCESENEHECDVPACDDFTTFSNLLFDVDDDFSSSYNESFSDKDFLKEIYSNPLFDEETISIKINPHHFNVESDLIESPLNQDSSIISSSKIDSLLDEFAEELIILKSIPPGIDKADCNPEKEIRLIEKLLYGNSSPRPPEEFIYENSDATIKSFSPSPIPIEDNNSFRDEIDLSLTPDDSMPPSIKNDD